MLSVGKSGPPDLDARHIGSRVCWLSGESEQ
jgi:hypothetical protein